MKGLVWGFGAIAVLVVVGVREVLSAGSGDAAAAAAEVERLGHEGKLEQSLGLPPRRWAELTASSSRGKSTLALAVLRAACATTHADVTEPLSALLHHSYEPFPCT